jgi:hypothetical protein
MEKIRLATQSEMEGIAATSDLTPQSTVVVFENAHGTPDIAVVRQVTELDPVLFAETSSHKRRAFFIWSLENAMRIMGAPSAYYFNVLAGDVEWQEAVKSWGSEQISVAPELRFKRLLVPKES